MKARTVYCTSTLPWTPLFVSMLARDSLRYVVAIGRPFAVPVYVFIVDAFETHLARVSS